MKYTGPHENDSTAHGESLPTITVQLSITPGMYGALAARIALSQFTISRGDPLEPAVPGNRLPAVKPFLHHPVYFLRDCL